MPGLQIKAEQTRQVDIDPTKMSDKEMDSYMEEKGFKEPAVETEDKTEEKEDAGEDKESAEAEEPQEKVDEESESEEESEEGSEEESEEEESEEEVSEEDEASALEEDEKALKSKKEDIQDRIEQSKKFREEREKEIAQLDEDLKKSELDIDRLNNDLGSKRKLSDLRSKANFTTEQKEKIKALMDEDPALAIQLIQEQQKAQEDHNKLELEITQRKQVKAYAESVEKTVTKRIPDFKDRVSRISEAVKELFDGGEEFIETFKKNPYHFPPELLLSLDKNADLLREVKQLRKEKKMGKPKSGTVSRVKKASKGTKSIASKSSNGSRSGKAMTAEDFQNMTPEQLSRLPKEVFNNSFSSFEKQRSR